MPGSRRRNERELKRTPETATKRQLIDDARQAALNARWDEAITLNVKIIERAPKDAEAQNRLGRAFLTLGRQSEAAEAYSNALRADPANLIARRNLQRLESLRHQPAAAGEPAPPTPMPRTAVFIEEVGKTWVDELINPIPREELSDVLPAEQLQLEVEGDRLVVRRLDGRRLGEIEAKTAERVINLIAVGNRYEVYALGLSAQGLRVILREVHRDPSRAGRFSFLRQITSRAYLRERDLLRQRDESDFFLLDDDDDDDDETTPTESEEDEPAESDAEPFVEDTVTVVEEEETTL